MTIRSSVKRRGCSNTAVMTDPISSVSVSHKLTMFTSFIVTYIYTWLYYNFCYRTEVVVSWIECSGKRGPCLLPILKWTTIVFIWINTIGFIRLVRSY